MKFIKFFFIIFITFPSSIKADLNQELSLELKKGGKLIFIRHAYAHMHQAVEIQKILILITVIPKEI